MVPEAQSAAAPAPARNLAGPLPWPEAVGALSGLLVIGAFARFGLQPRAAVVAGVAVVLVLLAAIDLERRLIPNRIVVPATAVTLLVHLMLFPDRAVEWAAATLAAGLLLGIPALLFPAALGMGDAKLAALLGAALGWTFLDALAIGFIATFPLGVWMTLRQGRTGLKATFPLGPFLAAGGLLHLFLQ